MIMEWRDREGSLNFGYLGNGRVEEQEREKSEEMREIIITNWNVREFGVRVNLTSSMRQV